MGKWLRPITGWFAIHERRDDSDQSQDGGPVELIPAVEDEDRRRRATIEVKLFGDLPAETSPDGTGPEETLAECADPDPDSDYTTDLGSQTLRRDTEGWRLT